MKMLIFILTSLLTCNLIAQNITNIEYFIDSDPGFGSGTQVSISPGTDIAANITIDINAIDYGFHILFIRGNDSTGKWSIAYAKPFVKQFIPSVPADIIQLEYFIDTDPGFGKGHNIAIAPGQDIKIDFIVDISALDDGFHALYVRGKDSNGKWSLIYTKPIHKKIPGSLHNITALRYYFANADTITPVYTYNSFTPASDVDLSFEVDLSVLADISNSYLHIYGIDDNGNRSIEYIHGFNLVGVSENPKDQNPTEYSLKQNFPNPFNPTTTISYQLPSQSHVTLKVFDVLGREVATLVNGVEEPGYKEVILSSNGLSSGIYYYRLQAVNYVETKKLLLLR